MTEQFRYAVWPCFLTSGKISSTISGLAAKTEKYKSMVCSN